MMRFVWRFSGLRGKNCMPFYSHVFTGSLTVDDWLLNLVPKSKDVAPLYLWLCCIIILYEVILCLFARNEGSNLG